MSEISDNQNQKSDTMQALSNLLRMAERLVICPMLVKRLAPQMVREINVEIEKQQAATDSKL